MQCASSIQRAATLSLTISIACGTVIIEDSAVNDEHELQSFDVTDPAIGGDVDSLDRNACEASLMSLRARFKYLGDVVHKNAALNLEATVHNEVELQEAVPGVSFIYVGGQGEVRHDLHTSCATAIALARSVRSFKANHPGITAVMDKGSINVRYIIDTAELSQHATGSAVDIAGFVYDEVSYQLPLPSSDTLFNAFYDAVAMNYGLVLGPRNDGTHLDHLHAQAPMASPSGCTLVVTQPLSGSILVQDDATLITWSSGGNCASQVNVRIHKGPNGDGTDLFSVPVEAPGANDGAISNVVLDSSTFPAGTDYYVCVSEAAGTAGRCGGKFTITGGSMPCVLAVTTPSTGGSFVQGSATTINWTHSGNCTSQVNVRIHKGPNGDGTDLFSVPVEAPGANDGAISNVVLDSGTFPAGTDYYVCVSEAGGTAGNCGGKFTITAGSTCTGLPNLLQSYSPQHQTNDDGATTVAYAYGTLISPVLNNDQIIFQVSTALPESALRICLDYEITGSNGGSARTAITRNGPPYETRPGAEIIRGVIGHVSECFDWPSILVGQNFSPTAVVPLRFFTAGDVDGYKLNDVTLCAP